eukprot:gene20252-31157_t
MAVTVSTTAVIAFTMVLSTIASVGGGVLLYFDSLTVLKERVRQVSESDTFSVVSSLNMQLDETMDTVDDLTRQVRMHGSLFNTVDDIRSWGRASSYSAVTARPGLYSAGLTAYPANWSTFDSNSDNYMYELSWGDLLKDGTIEYVAGTSNVTMGLTGMCKLPDDPVRRCVNAYSLNEDGSYKKLLYSYATNTARFAINRAEELRVKKNRSATDWIDFWNGPFTWTSSDDYQYVYASFYRVLNPEHMANHPFFYDKRLSLQAFIQFEGWSEMLRMHSTEATMAIVFYKGIVGSSIVIATNAGEMEQDCSADSVARNLSLVCPTRVGEQGHGIREALYSVVTQRSYDTFTSLSTPVGDVWVLATRVATQLADDTGGEYVLLWVLPVSSVGDDMQESLVNGVVFMGCVLLTIYSIGLVQIRLLASPLRDLAKATDALQQVNLDKTDACTAKADRGVLKMKEVFAVTEGLRFVVRSLRIVKLFLPQYALVGNIPIRKPSLDDGRRFETRKPDEEAPPPLLDHQPQQEPALFLASEGEDHLHALTANFSSFTVGGKHLNVLDTVKATVLTVRVHDTIAFSTFGKILSQFEHAASSTNGMLHPLSATLPYQLTITWNTYTPCVGGVNRACTVSRGLCDYLSHRLSACAISSGPCRAGFVGTRRTLGFAICGPPIDIGDALLLSSAEYTPVFETPVVAICAATQASIRGTYRVTPIDLLSANASVSTAWMLGCKIVDQNVEWMYQPNSSQHSLEPLFARLVRTSNSLPSNAGGASARAPDFSEPKDDEIARIVVRKLKERYPNVVGSASGRLLRYSGQDMLANGHPFWQGGREKADIVDGCESRPTSPK